MKYTLLVNKTTQERSVRINKTGEIITESVNPTEYLALRKKALSNAKTRSRNEFMKDCGLVRVKGAISGRTYYE